eukprot:scaffold6391_cov118-Alexandrium_tamarense.AAC.8
MTRANQHPLLSLTSSQLLGTRSPAGCISANGASQIDAHGRCRLHPQIVLRKKSALRGWKIVNSSCSECDLERSSSAGSGGRLSKRRSAGGSSSTARKSNGATYGKQQRRRSGSSKKRVYDSPNDTASLSDSPGGESHHRRQQRGERRPNGSNEGRRSKHFDQHGLSTRTAETLKLIEMPFQSGNDVAKNKSSTTTSKTTKETAGKQKSEPSRRRSLDSSLPGRAGTATFHNYRSSGTEKEVPMHHQRRAAVPDPPEKCTSKSYLRQSSAPLLPTQSITMNESSTSTLLSRDPDGVILKEDYSDSSRLLNGLKRSGGGQRQRRRHSGGSSKQQQSVPTATMLPTMHEDDDVVVSTESDVQDAVLHQSSSYHHQAAITTSYQQSSASSITPSQQGQNTDPCIYFRPRRQHHHHRRDESSYISTCSSFTESLTCAYVDDTDDEESVDETVNYHSANVVNGRQLDEGSSKQSQEVKQIIICGMPYSLVLPNRTDTAVTASSLQYYGKYTGQLNAKTKLPHGLGSLRLTTDEIKEGVWHEGLLLDEFGGGGEDDDEAANEDTFNHVHSSPISQKESSVVHVSSDSNNADMALEFCCLPCNDEGGEFLTTLPRLYVSQDEQQEEEEDDNRTPDGSCTDASSIYEGNVAEDEDSGNENSSTFSLPCAMAARSMGGGTDSVRSFITM